jgi:hypothetical protein
MSSLVLQAPLVLPEQGGQRVQVLVSEKDDRTEVSIYSPCACWEPLVSVSTSQA